MEWLTQSLPDVRRDSEKARMGSNDLAPCSALLYSHHHCEPRFIYFFFAAAHVRIYVYIPRG